MNAKRAYYILTTVTSDVGVCVRVCACVESYMWCLFCYLKRKPNVPVCSSACGPKKRSVTHRLWHRHCIFFLMCGTSLKPKTIKKWECVNDNQSELFRDVQTQCELLRLSVLGSVVTITSASVCTGSLSFILCLYFSLCF